MHAHAGAARTPAAGLQLGTGRKLLLSAAAIGASMAVMATGTYAAFSASVSRGHQVNTGVPLLVLGAVGGGSDRLGVNAPDLVPGQSVYRSFDVTNGGTVGFTAMTLSTASTTSSLLDTDPVHGLQARIERCSVPWTESGLAPLYSYACGGTRTTVVAFRPVAMTAVPLSGMQSAAPGGTDHLLLTETLPVTADNTFVDKTSALTFTINAS